MEKVIQAHLVEIKHTIAEYAPHVDVSICISPKEAIQSLRLRIRGDTDGIAHDLAKYQDNLELAYLKVFGDILGAMETLVSRPLSAQATIYHRIADIILQYFGRRHGCSNWPFREIGLDISESAGKREEGMVTVTQESYDATLKAIAWAGEKLSTFRQGLANATQDLNEVSVAIDAIRPEYARLSSIDPSMAAFASTWCGGCMWNFVKKCNERRDFLMANYKLSRFAAMEASMDDKKGGNKGHGKICQRSPVP